MIQANGQTLFDTTDPTRYQASRRVTFVSIGTNLVLAIGQVIIGIVGHSQALVADGMHTLADLSSDLMVLFALKHSAKEADEEHPYGHARIETAVTVVLGAMLLMVGVGIAVRAAMRLGSDAPFVVPSVITLVVAGLTIVAKEGLYRYTARTARRFNSDLLQANAWHHRSDAISSVVVFIGIGGSIAGVTYLDAAAAIGVALFVAKIGLDLGWSGVRELIDTGLERDQLQRIRRAILGVSGVKALHLLRTRQLGGQALVDVHIIVDQNISVSEGHQISEAVRVTLIHEIDVVADVMVHIDPEDDANATPSRGLPLRDVVEARLRGYFKDIEAAPAIEGCILHYVDGRLHIELLLPLDAATTPAAGRALAERFRAAVRHDPQIASLDVRFH